MECGFPEKGMNVDLTEHITGCMLGLSWSLELKRT